MIASLLKVVETFWTPLKFIKRFRTILNPVKTIDNFSEPFKTFQDFQNFSDLLETILNHFERTFEISHNIFEPFVIFCHPLFIYDKKHKHLKTFECIGHSNAFKNL